MAGDAIGGFKRGFAGLFIDTVTFDYECLLNMWEVEVVVELGGDPDFAGFNSPVIRGIIKDEIRFPAVSEVELDIRKKCRLVSLNGEMIMGPTF